MIHGILLKILKCVNHVSKATIDKFRLAQLARGMNRLAERYWQPHLEKEKRVKRKRKKRQI
jgi:hypothetical protein